MRSHADPADISDSARLAVPVHNNVTAIVGTTANRSNVANSRDRNGARVRSLRVDGGDGFSPASAPIAWPVGFRISFIQDNLRGYTRSARLNPADGVMYASILEWHGNVVVPRPTF